MNSIDQIYIPPHNIEAEQSVIGAVLMDGGNAFDKIEGIITEADFYRHEHRLIFSAAHSLANTGKAVDIITVAEVLEGAGDLERAGGLSHLGDIIQNTPSAANVVSYAKTVHERALQRRLLALSIEVQGKCMAPGADVAEIISEADAAMVQLLDTGTDEPTMLYDAMAEAIILLREAWQGAPRLCLRMDRMWTSLDILQPCSAFTQRGGKFPAT